LADDPELLDLWPGAGAARSHRLESPRAKSLGGSKPTTGKPTASRYQKAIDEIQRRGISVNGCFIVGSITTRRTSFRRSSAS